MLPHSQQSDVTENSAVLTPFSVPGIGNDTLFSLDSTLSSPRNGILDPLSRSSSSQNSLFDTLQFSSENLSASSSVINALRTDSPLGTPHWSPLVPGSMSLLDTSSSSITNEEIQETKQPQTVINEHIQSVYLEACRKIGVIPCETVLANLIKHEICLKHRSLGPTSIKAICIALVYNTNVTVLDLQGNNLGPAGAISVSQLLSENRSIVSLNLSQNSITSDGLKSLSKGLSKHKRMQRLLLSGNHLLNDVGKALCRIVETNENLVELHLDHNEVGDKTITTVAKAIGNSEALRILNLGWNRVNRKGAKCLSQVLRGNTYLEELDLSWNGLGPEGCVYLGRLLASNKGLKLLNLNNNRVTVAGLGHILDGLSTNDSLISLKVANNPITCTGVTWAVVQIIASKNKTLEEFDLGNNPVEMPLIDLLENQNERETLKVRHGATVRPSSDCGFGENADDVKHDIMVQLFDFMRQRNLRVIDLFNTFGRDGTMNITKQDIRRVFRHHMMTEIPTEELSLLMKRLDINEDGKVSLQDMISSQRYHNRKMAIQAAEERKRSKDAVLLIRKSMPKW